ncbi:MAG: low molecular weight phosphotyrosine protein phosphatase [Lachnospiraceae bacterium]|nr:low molecular weight phosphotyrosine protein phosphatase [Lachnospiraceae bacterium]
MLRKEKIMIRILFVCHGNICRSPMAEFIFNDLVRKRNLSDLFFAASAATSYEEIGNPVYPQARRKLEEAGISAAGKYARRMEASDYHEYDYLIGMERRNRINMEKIAGGDPEHKMHRLLDFTDRPGDIADPWYTRDFDTAYREIREGCESLLGYLLEESKTFGR